MTIDLNPAQDQLSKYESCQVVFDKAAILGQINFRAYYESELGLDLGSATTEGWTRNINSPFRQDNNPSFGINLNTGCWKDFGAESGSVFDFYMKRNGVDFPTALKRFAEFAGGAGHGLTSTTIASTAKPILRHYQLGFPIISYPYTDETGNILYSVCRFESKKFRPCDPAGGWKVKGIKHVPYNLPAMKKAHAVFLVEGEKDADRLNSLGLIATCKANWTGKWSDGFADEFFTGKTVYILQDNDEKGMGMAQDALLALKTTQSSRVKVISPFGERKGYDVSDWLGDGHTKEDLLKIVKETPWSHNPKADRSKFKLVRLSDVQFRPPDWLVKGVMEMDSLTLLFGDPASAKTFAAIDIACCVATGKDFYGMPVKSGPFIYIAGEGQNGIKRRFMAWGVKNGIDIDEYPIYLSLIPAALTEAEQVEVVKQAIESVADECGPPALIAFDTVARNFGPGDENSTKDMTSFVAAVDEIRAEYKSGILLVHHTGHMDKSRARGSMALKGALDSEYRIEKDDTGTVRMTCIKMKDHLKPASMAFKLATVGLGIKDDDGEEITSAILNPVEYSKVQKKGGKGKQKLSDWQEKALDALKDLVVKEQNRLIQARESHSGAVVYRRVLQRHFIEKLEMPKATVSRMLNNFLPGYPGVVVTGPAEAYDKFGYSPPMDIWGGQSG